MNKTAVKFCILGAGPSGLAFARQLQRMGERSFIILEQNSRAGGLCRSTEVDGSPIDIGGGHFLDTKIPEVLEMLFEVMPRDEWNHFHRIARILLKGEEIDHPLEGNLWQLDPSSGKRYLDSIAEAGSLRGSAEPDTFAEWIPWKFGKEIAENYLLPYNRKIWRLPLSELGTYWMHKLPNVSYQQMLDSFNCKKPHGELASHADFFYPKRHGFGEVWLRLAEELKQHLHCDEPVGSIDVDKGIVNDHIQAGWIVNTIPWTKWISAANLPAEMRALIQQLRHTSIDVDYHPENYPSDAHWIYLPDEEEKAHRLLLRHNFVSNSQGYWMEINSSTSGDYGGFRHRNPFAYPVNTVSKPSVMRAIKNWAARNHILPLGRWGEWEHVNSDKAVLNAMRLARQVMGDHE